MKVPRISLLACLLLIAAGIFAAAPYRASESDAAAKTAEAARLNNIGVAYMNQQLFEKALKQFEAAVAQDPKLTIAKLNRGVALLNLQKVDEAKTILEEVTKQDPKDAHAWYNLGLLSKNTNETDTAIAAFKHVTEIDPNDADTWYFLGTAYAQAKQYPQAIDAFEHALKLNPLHASAEFGISRAYQQSGNTDTSREHLKKFQYIKDNKLGSPMSLSYGEQGQYSRAEESAGVVEKVPAEIPVKFVDVTAEAGLVTKASPRVITDKSGDLPSSLAPGACFFDYDNDGQIDVLLPDNGAHGGLALFHNRNSKFEDVTTKAGLDPVMHAYACAIGDYDNDGFPDIALTPEGHLVLMHNEKDGSFKDATTSAGLTSDGPNVGLTWIDYDHDGDLDLYVTRTSMWKTEGHPENSTMWRNNGDGTFTNVTLQIAASDRASLGAIGTDYNNDRAIDLVVVRRPLDSPVIFENPREGKFLLREMWSDKPEGAAFSGGTAVLDFNHDGWMDIAFTHMGEPGITLWRNNKAKSFDRVDLPNTNWVRAFGVAAIDYDNDGWVDLVAVGETKDGKGEVRLFRNLGPDGFKDVTADVGLDKIQLKDPRAIITGDYDNDGAVDLLITQNHGPAVLLT